MFDVMIAFGNSYNANKAIEKLKKVAKDKGLDVTIDYPVKFEFNPGPTFTSITIGDIVRYYITSNVYTRESVENNIEKEVNIAIYDKISQIVNCNPCKDAPPISIYEDEDTIAFAIRILYTLYDYSKEEYIKNTSISYKRAEDVHRELEESSREIRIETAMSIREDQYDEVMVIYNEMIKKLFNAGVDMISTTTSYE